MTIGAFRSAKAAFSSGKAATALIAMLVAGPLHAAPAPVKPANEPEPPLEFTLEIDGKPMAIAEGRPFEADIGGKQVPMKLSIKPNRVFDRPGIRFSYPRHYTFEATKAGEQSITWVFSGNDSKLIVMRYPGEIEPASLRKELSSAMMTQYAADKPTRKEASIQLGTKTYVGDRIDVTLAGTRQRQGIFAVPAGKAVFVLILQDSPQPDGKPADETAAAWKLLSETFELKP